MAQTLPRWIEVAKKLAGFGRPDAGGCLYGGVIAKAGALVVESNVSVKLFRSLAVVNAWYSAGVVGLEASVCAVLGLRTKPKIAAPIVEAVAVNVIHNYPTICSAKNESMHQHIAPLARCWPGGGGNARSRIKGITSIAETVSVPAMPRYEVEVGFVDYCNVAFGQWYFKHRRSLGNTLVVSRQSVRCGLSAASLAVTVRL